MNFNKYPDGLLPAVVQDNATGKVLMLGFMNQAALAKTMEEKRVCFYSRNKQRLWVKGETSGHYLDVVSILQDCDEDTLLLKVRPAGPVCHLGTDTCFGEENVSADFLGELETIIMQRKNEPDGNSYTSSLFQKGINKIAQKVGEEATELIIEAKDNDRSLFLNEAADLLFHYLVLLAAKDSSLDNVLAILRHRHQVTSKGG